MQPAARPPMPGRLRARLHGFASGSGHALAGGLGASVPPKGLALGPRYSMVPPHNQNCHAIPALALRFTWLDHALPCVCSKPCPRSAGRAAAPFCPGSPSTWLCWKYLAKVRYSVLLSACPPYCVVRNGRGCLHARRPVFGEVKIEHLPETRPKMGANTRFVGPAPSEVCC